jgi:hypothetical protein
MFARGLSEPEDFSDAAEDDVKVIVVSEVGGADVQKLLSQLGNSVFHMHVSDC